MRLVVDNQPVHVATGGQEYSADKPVVVMLHGSGLDHRCWALQSRWFAFHGFSVFAPDLPGHSLSAGEPLSSIEQMGQWVAKALEVAGAGEVHLVGHSQGFLTALEAAPLLGDKLKSITAVATAEAIPVNPALIETAELSAAKAAKLMLQWGFGHKAQFGLSAVPGMQPIAIGQQIMSNNPLAADLIACNNYSGGAQRIAQLSCERHVILAGEDRMTPLKAGLALAETMDCQAQVIPAVGHMLPIEAPKACLEAMKILAK